MIVRVDRVGKLLLYRFKIPLEFSSQRKNICLPPDDSIGT